MALVIEKQVAFGVWMRALSTDLDSDGCDQCVAAMQQAAEDGGVPPGNYRAVQDNVILGHFAVGERN